MTSLVNHEETEDTLNFQDVFDELEKFVYWLSHRDEAEGVWLMDSQEIQGELFEEMWKGFVHYRDEITDMDEMKAVLRRMFDYRISELRQKYMNTHRGMGIGEYSLDQQADRTDHPEADGELSRFEARIVLSIGAELSVDTTQLALSHARVQETAARLSDTAWRVFDAVIHGHPLLAAQLKLSGERAKYVYKTGGTIKVKRWHVANALAMDEGTVKDAFIEIRKKYEEVCRDYSS